MDWTKFVRNMFTNRGKEGHHTWPRSLLTPQRNHLCARKLSYQHSEKPDILRLNSVGEAATEDEFISDSSGLVKRGILGDIPIEGANNNMPCYSNSYQKNTTHRMGLFHQNGWFSGKRNPADNGYNFNMAQRHYRFPAFGIGCQPPPPWQQYGNGWAYPYWPQGSHGAAYATPFLGNGHPNGYTYYHQGMPFVANTNSRKGADPHRQCRKKVTQVSHSQENNHSAKNSHPQKSKKTMQVPSPTETQTVSSVVGRISVKSIADNLKELQITSENCDGPKGSIDSHSKDSTSLRMHITIQKDNDENTQQDANTKPKNENIPFSQQRVCDSCKNCSSKEKCVAVGYCLLKPSSGQAKVTLILGSNENVGKLSNVNGKNGYHEKVGVTHLNDSTELSDETVPSQKLNDLFHKDQVPADDISSKDPSFGSKLNLECSSTPSNHHVLAQVLLQRSMSSKRKQKRPSSKKRNKDKPQKIVRDSDSCTKTAQSKKLKINHRDHEVPSNSNSKSKTHSTIAYILGVSPPQQSFDGQRTTQGAQIHCKVSVQPEKFSFTISSSDDTDFSDDDDDLVALSEDDADIWNSFNKSDDPYNPLNFLTSTCSSTAKVIPKSSSAPSLLSSDVLQSDAWYKEPPTFSPPKIEALIRTAKKVHFATDAHMVQVHDADDWERKGPWEQMALDSKRFEDRVKKIDEAIGYVFNEEHRLKIMKKLNLDMTFEKKC